MTDGIWGHRSATTLQRLAALPQVLIAACSARASHSAPVRLDISPFGIAGTKNILNLLANARHPGFRPAAVARNQPSREAMLHFIVDTYRQLVVTNALHAPKAGIGRTQSPAGEWHAGAEREASCGQDCNVPTTAGLSHCVSAVSVASQEQGGGTSLISPDLRVPASLSRSLQAGSRPPRGVRRNNARNSIAGMTPASQGVGLLVELPPILIGHCPLNPAVYAARSTRAGLALPAPRPASANRGCALRPPDPLGPHSRGDAARTTRDVASAS